MEIKEYTNHPETESQIGSRLWFEKEAWKALHREKNGVWDFSDSSLLYSPASISAYRQMQEGQTEYANNVTNVEHEVIRKTALNLMVDLPNEFAYVDLGPGTEHKELYYFEAAQKTQKVFRYYPVDISKTVLDESIRFTSKYRINSQPINARFEDIGRIIEHSIPTPRFVSLGATFANYEPDIIVPLALQIAGKGGSVMITAQLRDRIDINEVKKAYASPQMVELCNGKLNLLGIQPEDIRRFNISNDIIVRAQIKKPSHRLTLLGMNADDWVTVLKSYRWSRAQLETILSKTRYTIHDTNETFVVIHFHAKDS